MNWKSLWLKPFIVLSSILTGLSAFVGLLVNFQEATTQMSKALPFLVGFLPIIALAGTTFFAILLILFIIWGLIQLAPKVRSMWPSEKFKACYPEISDCFKVIEEAVNVDMQCTNDASIYGKRNEAVPEAINRDMRLRPDDYLKITALLATLKKCGIDLPSLEQFDPAHPDMRKIWHRYFKKLSTYSQTGDLQAARNIMQSIDDGGSSE